ncbi:MAG: N-acetylmuramoyl-L-alanine amidase [Ruminococcaceae bacterium]|nr:N-acetylmuramoyl-L-alanine amidase [Oscillospiraceae bacterium]
MKNAKLWRSLAPVYTLIVACFLLVAIGGSRAITVIAENTPITDRKCVVIDPGHGGEDGGAVSCTGINESALNLDIALRVNDLMHLLGIDTVMTRDTDRSIYTQGNTIAARKVSDLKERVKLANCIENAILVSIHQNHFSDSRYSGAQVFYNANKESAELAARLQASFVQTINYSSNRKSKKAEGIYLMEKVTSPAVLVECGFLSNYLEEAKLRDHKYQKQVAAVIAATCSTFLHGN